VTTMTTAPSFQLEWSMTPLATNRGQWTNIIHFTTGQNCCSPTDRIPYVALKNVWQNILFVAVSTQGNANDFLECPKILSNNQNYDIKLTVEPNPGTSVSKLRIDVDGVPCASKDLRGTPTAEQANVYMSDLYYTAADVDIRNVKYSCL